MRFLLKGDCHGNFVWLDKLEYTPEDTAIILLGDAGLNFYLNKSDTKLKKVINSKGFRLYCIHGNHEARPQDVSHIVPIYDNDVGGIVFQEENFPNIRYFSDYGKYYIGGYNVAIIGGAYSVDKWYRLQRAGILYEESNDPKKTGWFDDEQLTKDEMENANVILGGYHYDFVLSHTCPLSFQPRDLFLSFVNQSEVDSSMEIWMDELKDKFDWKIWCFGHYHADRIERPHVEQYFHDIEELDKIYERWDRYDKTGELDWWLNKSPNFYMK